MYYSITNGQEQRDELTNLFIRVGRIQFLILMLVASGFVFFGQTFIRFWAGEGYSESYYVCLLLMIPASIPLIQNLGIEIQRAANQHQFRSIVYACMAAVNLLLSIRLCQLYGAIGATIGTSISIVLANGITMNIYYFKKIGLDIPRFWHNILRMVLGMLPAFAVGVIIQRCITLRTVWMMMLYIAIYTIVYVLVVWKLSMNDYEKEIVMQIIRKVTGKLGGMENG